MYRNESGTREEYIDSIFKYAEGGFKDHVLTPEQENGPIRMWRCGRPGTGIYRFYVVVACGMITVYGDVGDNILLMYDEDPVNWICRSYKSTQYVIEKIRTNKKENVFFPDEAMALLDSIPDDYGNIGDESRKEGERFVKKVKDEWYNRDDFNAAESFFEAFCYNGGEAEYLSATTDYESGIYWTVACLKKFVELYNDYYGEND